MDRLSHILAGRQPIRESKTRIQHEWQAFAYKIWKEYSGNNKELPRLMRLVKTYYETAAGAISTAYHFCRDYTGPIPKLKLFYWKFWKLHKLQTGGYAKYN